jgi:predicted nucleotidyltransferase component of viral defense system
MQQDELKDFVLVGGTALSLQIGHRISIDIDLFGKCELENVPFGEILTAFGETTVIKKSKRILIYSVSRIKVDFVDYQYNLLYPPIIEDSIRIASEMDIAAMKLNAITGRGSKKDFIDLFFLLKKFTIEEMIGFYNEKYSDGSEFLVRKSLNYFDDADKEPMPIMLVNLSWEEIKSTIQNLL